MYFVAVAAVAAAVAAALAAFEPTPPSLIVVQIRSSQNYLV